MLREGSQRLLVVSSHDDPGPGADGGRMFGDEWYHWRFWDAEKTMPIANSIRGGRAGGSLALRALALMSGLPWVSERW